MSSAGSSPKAFKSAKWREDSLFVVPTRSPVQQVEKTFDGQVETISVFGYTDTRGGLPHRESNDPLSLHQAKLPRLPVPPLEHTCDQFLKSVQSICSSEEYFTIRKLMEKFRAEGGVGEQLHKLLVDWDETCGQPSWLEEFWDDAYLCPRDPIPINVNYFFGFEKHPNKDAMTQIGRAAGLLYGAVQYYKTIHDGTIPKEYERDDPVCMAQYRFIFTTARLPGLRRDRKVCYTTMPLTEDASISKSVEYINIESRHCVVIMRNFFFRLEVIREDGTLYPVEDIVSALTAIEEQVSLAAEPGPPVGLFTTMDRTDWFKVREHMKALGNHDMLRIIQSAIVCVALDSVEVVTSDEAARIFLHGSGTNRWFDRHNIIVTRDGWAGVNYEHSVGDGTTTLRATDAMYRSDCASNFTEAAIEKLMQDPERVERGRALVSEIRWKLDDKLNDIMMEAFEDFKVLIQANETDVLRFRSYGGNKIKAQNVSPDAYVQLALQLTYYRMFGRNCATYEAASTRTFLHGRTETLRSNTRTAWDFCTTAHEPIFSKRVGSMVPRPMELMRAAAKLHVDNMKLAKKALGVDRHFYGLRLMASKHNIPLPDLFSNPVFIRSMQWIMSTSHCGSSALSLFGFGPVVGNGFGIGYMIKNDNIDFVVTAKYSHPYTSATIFATTLQSTLLHMLSICQSESQHLRASAKTLLFQHPTGFNDFQYTADDGFSYKPLSSDHHHEVRHARAHSLIPEVNADESEKMLLLQEPKTWYPSGVKGLVHNASTGALSSANITPKPSMDQIAGACENMDAEHVESNLNGK